MKKLTYLIPALFLSATIAGAESFEETRASAHGTFAAIEVPGAAIPAVAEQVPPAQAAEETDDLKLAGPIYANVLKAQALFEKSAPPSAEELLGTWSLVTAASARKMGNFGFVSRYLSFVKTGTGLTAKIRKGLGYTDHAVAFSETSAVFSEARKMEEYGYTSEFRCRLAAKNSLICEIAGKIEHPEKQKELSKMYMMLERH